MQMKQPAWQSMPVLDVRALSTRQLAALTMYYDALSEKELAPLAQLKLDPSRCEIDHAITQTLGIPELRFIRELLDREPGMNARDIAPRLAQHDLALVTGEDEDDEGQAALF